MPPPDPPPNIVLIMVDDADAKVLNHAACSRIRAVLLDAGATATRYLTTHPQCAPSRASILRGRYPQNTGVHGNHGAYGAFFDNDGGTSNVARWLKAAPTPYRTGLVGKFINGYDPQVKGRPDLGFDYCFVVGDGAYGGYGYWAWDDDNPDGPGPRHYGGRADPANYLTDVLSGKAVEFLNNAATAEPFFLMVTPMAPHGPSNPSELYEGMYAAESYPKGLANESFNEADVSDKPYYISRLPLLDQTRIDRIDDRYRARLECMESVADLVEAVIATLAAKGWLDNTYVLFTSDHGYHMGEHRLGNEISHDDAEGMSPGGKNSMYEEDIRVPLWVRHASISESIIDHLIGNVDLAPTFCDIAGIDLADPPDVLDGRSFLPLLTGQQVPWRTQFLISRGQVKPYIGFRHADDWVFGQLLTPAEHEVEGELYTALADPPANGDPFELDNQYNTVAAQDPARMTALRTLAANYATCAGDTCRIYDSQAI